MRKILLSDKVSAPSAPYSQGVSFGNLVFVSGQVGMNKETGNKESGVEAQAQTAMKNVGAVLAEAGCGYEDILKTNIFLADIGDFAAVNAVYRQYFPDGNYPARTCVQAGALPGGALIEIEVIAGK